jgi:hypothetical protein
MDSVILPNTGYKKAGLWNVDPDLIRIQRLCGSGSVLGFRIRIGNPDPGAIKLRNFSGKMHFLVTGILRKNVISEKL